MHRSVVVCEEIENVMFVGRLFGAVPSFVCSGVCAYVCVCVVRASRARDGAQLAIRAHRGMRAV